MEVKKIKQLADVLVKSDLSELEIREGSDYLSLKRDRDGSVFSGSSSRSYQHQGSSAALVDYQQDQPLVAAVARDNLVSQPEALQQEPLSQPISNDDLGAASSEKQADLHYIESPMVGTFYRSGEPGRPPFVEVDSRIAIGDTVCIIEAMKMMNQINSEVQGRIVEVLVENGQPVEFGQRLFAIEGS